MTRIVHSNEFITNFRNNPGAERTRESRASSCLNSPNQSRILGDLTGFPVAVVAERRRMGGEEKRRNCRTTTPTDAGCGF
ncbi:unnamed protein product [Lasius platythorax]|uniref:Uncharacterized protein n=1 Tax=Lasius platythorax TaxID=488582 RepID=A0AAV2P3C2_9HYME